jgi:hypothetical protein
MATQVGLRPCMKICIDVVSLSLLCDTSRAVFAFWQVNPAIRWGGRGPLAAKRSIVGLQVIERWGRMQAISAIFLAIQD